MGKISVSEEDCHTVLRGVVLSKLVEEHGLSLVAVFTEVIPQLNILGMEVISGVLALEHTSLEYLVETINVFIHKIDNHLHIFVERLKECFINDY